MVTSGAMRPTERFSDRVDDYIRYRPGYPEAILDFLEGPGGLRPGARVADVGSGTGFFTTLLLQRGYEVVAVEPNPEMRAAAEARLAGEKGFHSQDGRAEATGLPARSVDYLTSAQAFHWFDQAKARAEFQRILRPGGRVALIWNSRRAEGSSFLQGYEALVREYAQDYGKASHSGVKERGEIERFFVGDEKQTFSTPHFQIFDFESLRGRLLSSSYSPKPGDPRYQPMMVALRSLFDRYQQAGVIRFDYDTEVTVGSLEQ